VASATPQVQKAETVVPATPPAATTTTTTSTTPPTQVPPSSQEGFVVPKPTEAPRSSSVTTNASSLPLAEAPFVRTAPGSIWDSFGRSPIERGNQVNYFHIDQGIVLGQVGGMDLTPFVAFDATRDSQGFAWNNKTRSQAGLKLVKTFGKGVVDFGGAYAVEKRQEVRNVPAETKSAWIGFTTGWFGWDEPTRKEGEGLFASHPGTAQWYAGNISPFEYRNLIAVGRVEQGVAVAKAVGVSFVPLVWGQAGFDSQNKPWNNRYIYGGGLKVALPWSRGVGDVQGGYECARTHDNHGVPIGSSMCGPTVKVDIWTGWRKKIGGL
jgi:hypothetical protein